MGGLWSCQTSVSTAYSRSSGNESGLLPTQGKGAHSGRNRIMCLWASLHFFSWGFWAQARHLVDAVQPTGYSAIQRFRGICRPSYTEFMAFFTPAEDQSTSAPIHAPWVGAAGIQQVSAAVLSSLQSLSLGHQSQWLVLLCLSFHLSQWSPLHLVLSLCLHRRPLLSQGFLWPPHQSPVRSASPALRDLRSPITGHAADLKTSSVSGITTAPWVTSSLLSLWAPLSFELLCSRFSSVPLCPLCSSC